MSFDDCIVSSVNYETYSYILEDLTKGCKLCLGSNHSCSFYSVTLSMNILTTILLFYTAPLFLSLVIYKEYIRICKYIKTFTKPAISLNQ